MASLALLKKSAAFTQEGMHDGATMLSSFQKVYLLGFVPLELYCTAVHPVVFSTALPFLPLLLTSVYCAVGLSVCWVCLAGFWVVTWQESYADSRSRKSR